MNSDATHIEFSYRERQVIRELLKDGADNQTIARRLGLDEETVKTYLQRTYKKTGLPTRTALVVALFRGDVVMLDEHGRVLAAA